MKLRIQKQNIKIILNLNSLIEKVLETYFAN